MHKNILSDLCNCMLSSENQISEAHGFISGEICVFIKYFIISATKISPALSMSFFCVKHDFWYRRERK